jgi:hypothetical protein
MHARQRALRVVETAEYAAGLVGQEFRRGQMELVAASGAALEQADAVTLALEIADATSRPRSAP